MFYLIQCQLRNKLLVDLKSKGLKTEQATKSGETDHEQSLFIKAANSIIIDFLESSKMEYTLSMFIPESGTENNMVPFFSLFSLFLEAMIYL